MSRLTHRRSRVGAKPASSLVTSLLAFLVAASSAGAQVLRRPVPDHVVVLTFDDAVVSHAVHVAPVLEKYGFGATFFVTEFAQPPFADTSLYMTWEQIRALSQAGFEIGNHTAHHRHVDQETPAELRDDLRYIEDRGIDRGIPKPLSFAYPAYATHPSALATLANAGYLFGRVGGGRPYDPARDHPLLIPSYSTAGDSTGAILRAFGEARDGKIVVLTVHGVPDTAHPWVNTPPAQFDGWMRWLHDHNYTVLALRDLAQFVNARQARETIAPRF